MTTILRAGDVVFEGQPIGAANQYWYEEDGDARRTGDSGRLMLFQRATAGTTVEDLRGALMTHREGRDRVVVTRGDEVAVITAQNLTLNGDSSIWGAIRRGTLEIRGEEWTVAYVHEPRNDSPRSVATKGLAEFIAFLDPTVSSYESGRTRQAASRRVGSRAQPSAALSGLVEPIVGGLPVTPNRLL
ncbi:MAG: hypothetical protein AAF654_09765 [Myxococcota bacterium]